MEDFWFVALIPTEDIQRETTAMKAYSRDHFESGHALRSPPHITLIPPFRWEREELPVLIRVLSEFAAVQKRFMVILDGFDCFAPRVIFVRPEPTPELLALQGSLAELFDNRLLLKKDTRPFHAHLTIAFKDLDRRVFPRAWAHFSAQEYRRTFEVDALALLHYASGRWEVYRSFPFP